MAEVGTVEIPLFARIAYLAAIPRFTESVGFPPSDGLPPLDGFPPSDGFPPLDGFPPSDELGLFELQAALREIRRRASAVFENLDVNVVAALNCGIGTDFLEGRASLVCTSNSAGLRKHRAASTPRLAGRSRRARSHRWGHEACSECRARVRGGGANRSLGAAPFRSSDSIWGSFLQGAWQ